MEVITAFSQISEHHDVSPYPSGVLELLGGEAEKGPLPYARMAVSFSKTGLEE